MSLHEPLRCEQCNDELVYGVAVGAKEPWWHCAACADLSKRVMDRKPTCPACGATINSHGEHSRALHEQLGTVDLDCQSCGAALHILTWAKFTYDTELVGEIT